jgi:hypothetical protein
MPFAGEMELSDCSAGACGATSEGWGDFVWEYAMQENNRMMSEAAHFAVTRFS